MEQQDMTAPDTLPGLRSRALQGVMLLGVQRAAGLLVATAGWLALARLLTPDAFGIYAIIAFAVGLGVAFGDLGFGAALIQRRDLDPTVCLSTVFLVHLTLATILGACLVERHVTLDRAMWGSDQAASVEPWGMMRLVRDIRVIEKALGDGVKQIYDSERPILNKLRRARTSEA